jgi:hypothetical protein
MAKKILIIIVAMFFIISCNNSNKNSKAKIDSDKTPETTVTQETATQEAIIYHSILRKPYKAVINSDCEYYYEFAPAGRLKQGQSILIMDRYYNPAGFDVSVEIESVDGRKDSFVLEKYITYDDEIYTAWFKNVLLTREYYRTESAEFINSHGSGYNLDKDNDVWSKKDILQMWRHSFSEERLRFSEKYFVIGDDENNTSYKIESVKKDGNKYTFLLSDTQIDVYLEDSYEITLIDNGNSIVMTQCVVINKKKEEEPHYYMISSSLNYNYVPYDEEKAKTTKSKVMAWIDEQLKKL